MQVRENREKNQGVKLATLADQSRPEPLNKA